MKYIKERIFPTNIYILDDVLDQKNINNIKDNVYLLYNKSKSDLWQSKSGLHKKLEYKNLCKKIKDLTKIIFKDHNYCYDSFDITGMWAGILKPKEFHEPHTHSNCILSGTFYLESDGKSPIWFCDPRPVGGVLPDVKEQNIDNSTLWYYPSIENRLIIFPSWLQHYVHTVNSNKNRIAISFNIMLKGTIGSHAQLNYMSI
tara:strand:- start:2614 stop:3216 length:603 start_codon:yes stop_codon:yes gene_type:complete